MEKSESKKNKGVCKPPLSVTGSLKMPTEILPWEQDLMAVVGT